MDPEDRLYTKEHQWIKIKGNTGTIGITDHAQKELKDIVFIELPDIGKEFDKGAQIASIESVKSVNDVFMPMSGKIIEVNEKLEDDPTLLNSDPYETAWICKVELSKPEEKDSLMNAKDYTESVS